MTTRTSPGGPAAASARGRSHSVAHNGAQRLDRVIAPAGVSYRLSAALALTATASSLPTYFAGGLLTGPAAMNGSARGTALVVLVIAVPMLVLSMRAAARGSARALMIWLGAAGYLLYNAVMFLFATPFNELFLLYVAMLSLAVWSVVAVLVSIDIDALGRRFSPELPVKALAVYTWVVVALNTVAWLGTIGPAIVSGDPSFLDGTGMTTNPVFVQDLAIWLPMLAVAAAWLWRRQPWGIALVGLGLVYWVIESISIAVDQWYGATADPSSSVVATSLVPVFAGLALIGSIPLFILLRNLDRQPDEPRRP